MELLGTESLVLQGIFSIY